MRSKLGFQCAARARTGPGALLLIVVLAACERDPAATRAILREQQQQWARDLGTLRQQEVELHARLTSLSTSGRTVAALRVAPLLNGARQSITDIEMQAQQADERLEPVLRQGGQAALEAIDAERTQIGGYLKMLRDQLETAGRTLGALERS